MLSVRGHKILAGGHKWPQRLHLVIIASIYVYVKVVNNVHPKLHDPADNMQSACGVCTLRALVTN